MLHETASSRLPIIVGVTGHRDLRAEDEGVLVACVNAVFDRLERAYPSTPLLVLSPLAQGADQLVASAARARGIAYRVPMPLPLESYRDDFPSDAQRARFDDLLRVADGPPYHVPFFEDNHADNVRDPRRRAHQYALLGAHLARACHVLVALWDGEASEAVGGTAQVVRFRTLGAPRRYLAKSSLLDAPESGAVHHIYAARSGRELPLSRAIGATCLQVGRPQTPGDARAPFERIEELPPDAADPFDALYRHIEEFNEDCTRVADTGAARHERSATKALMHTAERLATHYQQKIVRALRRLFGATALAVFTFEVYAHLLPNAHPLVVVYFCASAVAIGTYVAARRGRWQDRAQDYRALEIGLNVQQAWDAAALGYSVADYYIRRQRTELDWIRDAIRTAHIVDRRDEREEADGIVAVRAFVSEQHGYFAGTPGSVGCAAREREKTETFEAVSRASLRASLVASALLVVYGLVAWLAPEGLHGLAREDMLHGALIFAVASTAIAAALFHDYPARRGHPQQARRYAAMAALYGRALDVLDAGGESIAVTRECIAELGHEALMESGDWLLLHRELPIELLPVG